MWAAVMVAGLVLLCFYSGENAHRAFPYPTERDIAENPAAYLGKDVLIYGVVVESSDDWSLVSTAAGELLIKGIRAMPGARVEVLGTLEGSSVVSVLRAVVHPELDFYAMFFRSAAGLALVLLLFFRSWKLERWRAVRV